VVFDGPSDRLPPQALDAIYATTPVEHADSVASNGQPVRPVPAFTPENE
jgi:hypothetical protein